MLIFKGTEYRNLEEQVLKNKEDIAKHYEIDRALANLGIKVVGQVELPSELPDPLTYQGEFGDTYAVGNPEEVAEGTGYYEYYVYTRPDENAGTPTNHWLNVGRISIVGPQGPKGPQGEKGDLGEATIWYSGSDIPSEDLGKEGDFYLRDDGMIWKRGTRAWRAVLYIKGPQGLTGQQGPKGDKGDTGAQGPAGPQGDVGGFINIWGVLGNVGQLPLPSTLNNLTVAYLVEHTGGTDQANDHYDLYIQVGETSATAVWTNAGPFNAATLVTQGGVGLNVWDADAKLDKKTNRTNNNQAYVKRYNGEQMMIEINPGSAAPNTIVQRKEDGNVTVPETPIANTDAVSKKYADTKLDKSTPLSGIEMYYATNSGQRTFNIGTDGILGFSVNTPVSLKYGVNETANSIVQRKGDGNITVPETPTANTDAASKKYVDSKAGLKIYKHTIEWGEDEADYNRLEIYTTQDHKLGPGENIGDYEDTLAMYNTEYEISSIIFADAGSYVDDTYGEEFIRIHYNFFNENGVRETRIYNSACGVVESEFYDEHPESWQEYDIVKVR